MRTLITSLAEYLAGVDRMLALAERELLIFDPDGAQLALDRRDRIARLDTLLASGREHHVRLVVHDERHLVQGAPRLLELAKRFDVQLAIHLTESEARRAQDCFVIADGTHCVRRAVAAQSRGALIEDDRIDVAPQRERFEEIWAMSVPAITPTTLGL